MKRLALTVALLSLMVSCAPKADPAPKAEAPQSPAAAQPQPVQQPPAVDARTANLGKLGLSVFPEPQTIPNFSLKTPEGKTVSVADFKGKHVFLNFWATWCPPCREEMPSMEELHAKFGKQAFSILAVSVREDPNTVANFLKTNKYTFPIALDPDGAVSSMFVGRGIPTTYIIDPEGRAIAGMVGSRKWNTDEVYAVFGELVSK
jgi:thiol-disulfide isomerase/thioredoxin